MADSPLRPLVRKVIAYVESYPWNNAYTIAGRLEQEAAVEAVFQEAYNLGAQALMDRLAVEAGAPGCGDKGCVEHGSLPATAPELPRCVVCRKWAAIVCLHCAPLAGGQGDPPEATKGAQGFWMGGELFYTVEGEDGVFRPLPDGSLERCT